MDIYSSIDQVKAQLSSVLTIGTFDGVHVGHIELLNQVISKAKLNEVKSVVVTFDPHPKQILNA